jgi:hypothetical protein
VLLDQTLLHCMHDIQFNSVHVSAAFCVSILKYDQLICSYLFFNLLYDLYRTVPLCPFVSPKLTYLPLSKLVEVIK